MKLSIDALRETDKSGFAYKEVQPFVFADDTFNPYKRTPIVIDDNVVLASPFKQFSFELETDMVTLPAEAKLPHLGCAVFCCNEVSPGSYAFKILVEDSTTGERVAVDVEENHALYKYALATTSIFIGLIHARGTKIAEFKANRGGSGSTRNLPRTVIYIAKREYEKQTSSSGHKLHWKTSWAVMGHWRRLANPQSIGVDRVGQRSVKGYTWIADYVKGDGPMSKKTRKLR
jgi:hypothetical protein